MEACRRRSFIVLRMQWQDHSASALAIKVSIVQTSENTDSQ